MGGSTRPSLPPSLRRPMVSRSRIAGVATLVAAVASVLLVPAAGSSGVVVATNGSLTMSSDSGDYVGGGLTWSYDTQADYMKLGSEM